MALAIVSTVGAGNSTSSTTVATGATAHTAGNLLVAVVNWENPATNCNSVTDTAGNTYTPLTKRTSTNIGAQMFYAKNITGHATNVVTATFSTGTNGHSILVHEFSGADLTAPFTTGEEAGASGANNPIDAGNVVTSVADSVLVAGFVRWNSGGVWTAGADYAIGTNTNNINSGYMPSMMEYDIVAATGTYNGDATNTGGGEWLAVLAAFKGAAGGGTTWGALLGLQNNRLVITT